MMESELKRCPFCGASASEEVELPEKDNCIDFCVRCTSCGVFKCIRLKVNAATHFIDLVETMQQVRDLWNRRAKNEVN